MFVLFHIFVHVLFVLFIPDLPVINSLETPRNKKVRMKEQINQQFTRR